MSLLHYSLIWRNFEAVATRATLVIWWYDCKRLYTEMIKPTARMRSEGYDSWVCLSVSLCVRSTSHLSSICTPWNQCYVLNRQRRLWGFLWNRSIADIHHFMHYMAISGGQHVSVLWSVCLHLEHYLARTPRNTWHLYLLFRTLSVQDTALFRTLFYSGHYIVQDTSIQDTTLFWTTH